jgi:hypothetical protein
MILAEELKQIEDFEKIQWKGYEFFFKRNPDLTERFKLAAINKNDILLNLLIILQNKFS